MQIINLQITPNGVMPKVYASQFDVGREIQFNLYDGATAYIPPVGTQIRFEGKKSDGNGFSYECIYTDNVVTVVLTDQMTVFAEEVPCELRLADYSGDIGTLNIILAIEKSPIDENTPMSDTEIPAIIELARSEQYNAEAWAEGTRNGVPVGPTDPTYENNAKYYAEHSTASIASLSDTNIQNLTDGQILKYDSNSGDWINANESGGGSSTLAGLTDVNLTTPTNNQVLKYDSVNQEWINGDAPSGAGGSTVTITTAESALYGETVTITDGVDTFTGTFDNAGICEIQGVTITGSATVSATGGGQTATASLTMPYFGNYSTTLSFFSATVTVTFPYANGASCTLSDGVTTLTANTSPMAFNVPNTGTWTATVTLDGQTKTDSATITSDGQTANLTIEYGTINLSYDNDFKGETITCTSGGTTITKTAPNDANAMAFYPPTTGNWTISGTVNDTTYVASPNPVVVSSLSTAVSAQLQTMVTKSVTMYGAAGAIITWQNADGSNGSATMDNNGQALTSVKILPTGSNITFTDTTVAKNPNNLSQNYTKTVAVTNATTEIYVMPDKTIYWYGYKGDIDFNAYAYKTNGYAGVLTATYNTTNFEIKIQNTSGYTYGCALKTLSTQLDLSNASSIKLLGRVSEAHEMQMKYGITNTPSNSCPDFTVGKTYNPDIVNFGSGATTDTVYTADISGVNSGYLEVWGFNVSTVATQIKAIWCE